MQPTPAPGTPPTTDPVVELIRAQRLNVGYALTAVAFLCLVGTVALALKTSRLSAATTTATDKGKNKDAEDPFQNLPGDDKVAAQPNKFDYVIGAFGAALALVITGAGGAYLLIALPKPTEAEQRREARVLILAVGGLLGAFLILVGALFFLRWGDSLVQWLDKNEAKEAKYALYPLLMIVAGGGLTFLAIQPARAEERNNKTIRQLVYGSNFGLTVLILFVVLIFANAVVAMRLPNKLDTTSNAFFSLNPQTKEFLETLETPIHAYAIFQEGPPEVEDIRRLLKQAEDVNRGKFRVTNLSPALNRSDIAKLKSEFPMAEMSREGVLLVAGEGGSADRQRHTFIRADEFVEQKEDKSGRPTEVFNGEPKLLREMMFLAESKVRPKVYFTQSAGELALGAGGRRADARRAASVLKGYLEKNYFDVQPLVFDDASAPKVPDDAAVVVVADPSAPLHKNGVEALRKYMSETRANAKKGKLVVLAGAQGGPDQKPLQTGLEPILQSFGVRLTEKFLYAAPEEALAGYDRARGIRTLQAGIAVDAVKTRNPVAMSFISKLDRVEMVDCRELTSEPAAGFTSTTVLLSLPNRLTWQAARQLPAAEAWKQMEDRLKLIRALPSQEERLKAQKVLQTEMDASAQSRELAVFVSEGKDARVAVFGCGWFLSDEAAATASDRFGSRGATIWLDLMGSTLDWIRDRPTVTGIQEKPYTNFTLKPGYDNTRLTYVPLGLGLLLVLGLGAGVWAIRRK